MAADPEASLLPSETDAVAPTIDAPDNPTNLTIAGVDDLQLVTIGETSSLYQGNQPTTGRLVAVKVLRDELTSESGQRFDRERTITGRLSGHAAVVPLFETGVTADDEPYLVMPFYQRGSLGRLIETHGPLAWREATYLLEAVAVTLAEAHSRGIVHRNLRPSNVLLTDFLLPRVGGFDRSLPIGEAVPLDDSRHDPFFLPTEAPTPTVEAEADTGGKARATPTCDVYSLGAVLWAMLAGWHPGRNDYAPDRAVDLARSGFLPEGTMAPRPILQLVAQAMKADPMQRPANAAAFVTELRRSVVAAGQAADPALRPEPVPPPDSAPGATTSGAGSGLGDSQDSGLRNQTPESRARALAAAPDSTATGPTADHGWDPADPDWVSSDDLGDVATGDSRYVLALVGSIAVVILIMVMAAALAVG